MNIEHMTLSELIQYGNLPALVVVQLERLQTLDNDHEKDIAATDRKIELLREQIYFAAQTINEFEAIIQRGDTPSAKIKRLRAELSACSLER